MARYKHYFCLSDYGEFGLCGPNIKLENTEAEWKLVTCPKCLKKRKATK
jgi:hypothetical protein